jgi:hypothetical protein
MTYKNFRHQKLSNTASLRKGVRAAYLSDGMMYSRVEVFMWDIELQAMTQSMDGGQASFYLNIAKLPNRGSS